MIDPVAIIEENISMLQKQMRMAMDKHTASGIQTYNVDIIAFADQLANQAIVLDSISKNK